MLHEIWAGGVSWPQKMIGIGQRQCLLRLCRHRATVVHTSNETYQRMLAEHAVSARLLPLFGSLPIADTNADAWLPSALARVGGADVAIARQKWWLLTIFGTLHPAWRPEPLMRRLQAVATESGRRLALISVGRLGPGESLWQEMQSRYGHHVSMLRLGEQPETRISQLLNSVDFGVSTSPYTLVGKSATMAAMMEHGVPVIVTREDGPPGGSPALDEDACIRLDDRFAARLIGARRRPRRRRLSGDRRSVSRRPGVRREGWMSAIQAGAEIAPRPVEAVADGDVVETLHRLARRYPPDLAAAQVEDVPRTAFHIALVRDRQSELVCDLGGGVGLFSLGCAALGLPVMLVDDFEDFIHGHRPDSILALHRAHGVVVRQHDVTAGLDVPPASLGAVTCFHSIEHWHSSPKKLLADVMTALVPGGLFVLAAPNAVNLRKRISVPLGYGNWSAMTEWYDAGRFRGHVREPVVADLRAIARDMGLVDVQILGRNWLGLHHRSRAIRLVTRLVGRLLELQPSLCSDIYLIGRKPSGTVSRRGCSS